MDLWHATYPAAICCQNGTFGCGTSRGCENVTQRCVSGGCCGITRSTCSVDADCCQDRYHHDCREIGNPPARRCCRPGGVECQLGIQCCSGSCSNGACKE